MPASDETAELAEPAAPPTLGRKRWFRRAGVLLVVASMVGAGVWVTRDDSVDRLINERPASSLGTSGLDPAGERDARGAETLERQARAVRQGSLARYLAAWDSSRVRSQQRAETTFQNLRALGIGSLATRYVASEPPLGLTDQRRLGGTAWTAAVEVSYQLHGYDVAPARMTVSYTFVQRDDHALIVDVAAARGERAPIWILGPLSVRTSGRTMVAAESAPAAARVDRHLRAAVIDIEEVVPRWDGRLVAFVPSDRKHLESVMAAAPGLYDNIAAVTTTVDGSERPHAPVAIVVNASAFSRLGPIGAQVVITHESTHAATNAAVGGVPLWVAEGFADYIGVGSVDVPISISARVVIQDVRQRGLPASLPSSEDFAATADDLELAYEQAWLANRLLAQLYGEAALVRFYTYVVKHPHDVADAFVRLGTTESRFTSVWRGHLRSLT